MDKVTVAGTFWGGTGVPRVLVGDVLFTAVPAPAFMVLAGLGFVLLSRNKRGLS